MRDTNGRIKGLVIFAIILIILILVTASVLCIKIIKNKKIDISKGVISLGQEQGIEVKKSVKIFSGKDRPIAIMIDNHKDAWPQAGLNKAYCIYEIIVEGGETRMMALFKGTQVKEIGPVRSSRHYFLDYALENDAIYTHYGWSPQAQSDISTLKVNNINGITENEKDFWRIKQKSSPHNVMTSIDNIKKIAQEKKYRTTSSEESVLKYSTDEVELQTDKVANTVIIPYSTLHTTSYKYNSETKLYTRYARNSKQIDFSTSDDITTKNILITFVENYTLDDTENKGRQGIKNIGTKKGYYITNGKYIEITCQKDSRTDKTIYKDSNGNVINVNDGNTFINICPLDSKVKFE